MSRPSVVLNPQLCNHSRKYGANAQCPLYAGTQPQMMNLHTCQFTHSLCRSHLIQKHKSHHAMTEWLTRVSPQRSWRAQTFPLETTLRGYAHHGHQKHRCVEGKEQKLRDGATHSARALTNMNIRTRDHIKVFSPWLHQYDCWNARSTLPTGNVRGWHCQQGKLCHNRRLRAHLKSSWYSVVGA